MVANYPNHSNKKYGRRSTTFNNLTYIRRTMAAQGLVPAAARPSAPTTRPRPVGARVRLDSTQTRLNTYVAGRPRPAGTLARSGMTPGHIDGSTATVEQLRARHQVLEAHIRAADSRIQALRQRFANTNVLPAGIRKQSMAPAAQQLQTRTLPPLAPLLGRLRALAQRLPAWKPQLDMIASRAERLLSIPQHHFHLHRAESRALMMACQRTLRMVFQYQAAQTAAAAGRATSEVASAASPVQGIMSGRGMRLTFAMVPFESVPLSMQCEAADKAFANAPTTPNGTATIMTPRPLRFTIEAPIATNTWQVIQTGFVPSLEAAQRLKTNAMRRFLTCALKAAEAWREDEAVRLSRQPFVIVIDIRFSNESGKMLKGRKQVVRV